MPTPVMLRRARSSAGERDASSETATMPALPIASNSGSQWHRWEPHIHAPGTVLNDQFKGVDRWEQYLDALEKAAPVIRALGVTDYYSTESYQRVLETKRNGRLPACDLIFPNIEMRLAGQPRRSRPSRRSKALSRAPYLQGAWRHLLLQSRRSDPARPALRCEADRSHGSASMRLGAVQGRVRRSAQHLFRQRLGQGEHPHRHRGERDRWHLRRTRWRRCDPAPRGREVRPHHLREQSCPT